MRIKIDFRTSILLLSILFVSSTISAHASSEETKNLYNLSLNDLMQIKITGSTLTEESLVLVPSAVTVFTHEQLQHMGLDSLDELMNLVPGYQSYRSSTSSINTPFSVRGRRVGNVGSEVLVLIDGQRIENIRTGGSFSVLPKYPLSSIERVEFIRGPGSAVYGSSAMMGIVNIITRSNANELNIAVGSLHRTKGSLVLSHTEGDVQTDLQIYIDKDHGERYAVQDVYSPNQVTTEDPRELNNLRLKLKWKKTQVDIAHNESTINGFYLATTLFNNYNINTNKLNSFAIQQAFEHPSIDSWLRLSYAASKEEYNLSLFVPPQLGILPYIHTNPVEFTESQVQWHSDWSMNEKNNLQTGLEFRKLALPTATSTSMAFNPNDPTYQPTEEEINQTRSTTIQLASERDILGAYTQYQIQPLEKTHLTLGLRYDRFSNIGSATSPRIALVHKMGDHHNIKFLYGESFRAPTEDELNLKENPRFKGNPHLKPESVKTTDILWLGHWNNTFVSVGYFENHFNNSIVTISLPEAINQNANIEQGPTKGIELESNYEIHHQLSLHSSYTRITEKPELSYREADQLASLSLHYQHASWNANFIAVHHGERETPLRTGQHMTLDKYWQINSKVSYTASKHWTVALQVKNILDEKYHTPAASAFLQEGIINRGREILLELTGQL